MQLFIVTSSQTANRNLVPFFRTWGFPITDATVNATSALAEWLENPMKNYTTTGHRRRQMRAALRGLAY